MNNSISLPDNRDFKGVWIPAELYLNTDLSAIEKLIIVEIDSLSQRGMCFASNQHFADFLGLSVDRVKHIIPDLVKRGYLNSKTFYNPDKKKKERILTVRRDSTDQSAKNDTYQSAKNDTISITDIKYNSNIYNIDSNTYSKVNMKHDNNTLSATINCSMISAETAPAPHINKAKLQDYEQLQMTLLQVYSDIGIKATEDTKEKITYFFNYFAEAYKTKRGFNLYPVSYDKLIMHTKKLIQFKLHQGGDDSLLNYDITDIQWMIEDFFNYDFEDANYSLDLFMDNKVLTTRFRRLQNKQNKVAV